MFIAEGKIFIWYSSSQIFCVDFFSLSELLINKNKNDPNILASLTIEEYAKFELMKDDTEYIDIPESVLNLLSNKIPIDFLKSNYYSSCIPVGRYYFVKISSMQYSRLYVIDRKTNEIVYEPAYKTLTEWGEYQVNILCMAIENL